MEGNCWSIKVYARIKPFDDSKGSELAEYDIYDRVSVDNSSDFLKSKIVFNHKPSGETVNNKAEQQTFRFCKVFDQDTQQEEIFEVVAKPVVDSVLKGYNGTVFAYGQTGSGKTYSITGGPDKYEDRGIIPRSIQHIFSSLLLMPADIRSSVFISYCEIYNEIGYDLLDAAPKARKKLEDLPRVCISEDSHGNFNFRNLGLKKVDTEEEALNLLFLGDSNRVTAETPTNKTSSRSHCVFTIVLATHSDTSGISRRSKLNLVDLAGSERVSKTGINGKTLEEAKNINLSLHFLEQVIVALNTPDCKHVPYRNSMMTIILKDSLGGNCLTTMLATFSAELENIWETISTCRFAQRVALIKNEVYVNEELDPLVEVKILKEDIKALKRQLELAGARSLDVELTSDEIGECHNLVQEILSKEGIESLPQIPADLRKINQCTWLLKCAVTEAEKMRNPEVKELFGLLHERDEEIASLRGGLGMSTETNIAPYVQPGARPSSQSSSSKYFRPRGESTYSTSVGGRSRARDSQQLDDDRDIASRVENSMRRLASLRSLLDHTRTANNSADEGMNEFIASVIHQIHDDERDYRMLMALQYDSQAAEDLLIEQIEISKLKMLFDFRNLYQEHAISIDAKSGNTYYDQRSVDLRDGNTSVDPLSARSYPNQFERCLETLDEASSTLTNLVGNESVHTQVKSAKSRESATSVATRRSIANKTDISLENVNFGPGVVPRSHNVSTVSGKTVTSPRLTSHLSTVAGDVKSSVENAVNVHGELSPEDKDSAVSTITRRTHRVSIVPLPCEPGDDDARFRINGSPISTASRRSHTAIPSDNLEDLTSSPRSDGRSLQTEYAVSSVRRPSAVPQDLTKSTMQDFGSMRAEAGSYRDASAASVAKRVVPVPQKLSSSNASFKSIVPSEAPPDNMYSVYPSEINSTLTCSDTTRRSFLPQMGMSSFSAKPNSLACALVVGNVLDLRPTAAGSAQIGSTSKRTLDSRMAPSQMSAVSNPLQTDTSEGDNSMLHDNLCPLYNISASTRSSVRPQTGISKISTISKAPPHTISMDISDSPASAAPLANASAISTAKRRSVAPQATGTSTVSTKSQAPQSNISMDIANTLADAGSLAKASAISAGTRRSVPPQAGTSTESMKSQALQSNTSVDIANTLADAGSLAKVSAISTGTRRSIAPQATGTSSVCTTSEAPQSNISGDIANTLADAGSLAKVSAISTGTRRSVAPQTTGTSPVCTTSEAPQSNTSVDIANTLADTGSLAKVSAISTGTRRSVAPQATGTSTVCTTSEAPQSNISGDIANTLADAGSFAKASAISTGTRRSVSPQARTSTVSTKSKAPQSSFSVDTANTLADDAGSFANASAIPTGTRRSVSPQAGTSTVSTKSKAPQSNFSVDTVNTRADASSKANVSAITTGTRRSVAQPTETSPRRASTVSAATTRSPDPAMTGTSNVSAAKEKTENNGVATGVSPTSSLILDYLAPLDATSSLPNSSFNIVTVTPTGSCVPMSLEPHTGGPSETSYEQVPSRSSCESANDPNLNVASRNATGECDHVGSPSATSDMSAVTRPVNQDNTSSAPTLIPLESLKFPDGAVSSVRSAATSASRRQVPSPSSTVTNSREPPFSTGQSGVRPNNASTPAQGSATSAVSGRLDPECRVCSDVNASRNSSGVSSPVNKGGVSPREASRSSTKRNSASQDVGLDDEREHSQIAVLQSPMKCSTTSAAAPKSVSGQITSISPPAGNETQDPSLRTIYTGGVKEIPESLNTFQPREDMHQCDEETKCLALTATQAEFDAYYGVDRTDSYTCTITIPSTTPVTQDTVACRDIIPCSSFEFAGDAFGNTPEFSEASAVGGNQLNDASTPAARANLFTCGEVEPVFTIDELCLTGDPEIDEEIIAFYKARNCMG